MAREKMYKEGASSGRKSAPSRQFAKRREKNVEIYKK